jgi:hypothetical protein
MSKSVFCISRVTTVLALVLSAAQAHSGEFDNRCVQEQLTNLGFNTRGIDGNIGPGTRAAFAAYLTDLGSEDELVLDDESAESWCIQITLAAACRIANDALAVADLAADQFIGSRKTGGYSQLIGAFISETPDGTSAYIVQYSPYFPDRSQCEIQAGYWDQDAERYVFGDLDDTDYGAWVFTREEIQRIRARRVSMEQFRTMSYIDFTDPNAATTQ